MLTQNPPSRASPSPDDIHSSERKRKRKALSCYDCRRRKLGCDREFPACSRCRKSGQANSCTYEPGASDHKDQGDGEKPSAATNVPVVTAFEIDKSRRKLPSAPNSQTTTEPFAGGYLSKVTWQARRIAQLESRLAALEAHKPSAIWQCFGEVDSVAKPNEDTEKRTNTNSALFLTSPRPECSAETILFRGKNYKTQYYGGSHPTSLIAHVRTPFVLRIRSTKLLSFLNFGLS